MKSSKSRILFIVPYPRGISPGQRFRFEHYLDDLNDYRISSFISSGDYPAFFTTNALMKSWIILKGYFKRAALPFTLHHYSHIYIYRETSPVGPPVLMWLNKLFWHKPFIYDFDDAIWLRDQGGENPWVAAIKWKKKVRLLCKWASIITVGNRFLAQYAENFCADVRIIPTVVETHNHHRRTDPRSTKLVIGWTGSHSTLRYLSEVLPVLRDLRKKHVFDFHIIANRNPGYNDEFIKFIPWQKSTEIEDLQKFHIGIMPLSESAWSKGKCGFKAIQYLALETPAVVSPVGVNAQIVKKEEFGYHATSKKEWAESLEKLLTDNQLRLVMGHSGRKFIEENYSVEASREEFLKLFN